MQKIYLKNGKLCLLADSVDVLNKECTTLSGEFTTDADTVAFITTLLDKTKVSLVKDPFSGYGFVYSRNTYVKEMSNKLKRLEEQYEKLRKQKDEEVNELRKQKDEEVNELRKQKDEKDDYINELLERLEERGKKVTQLDADLNNIKQNVCEFMAEAANGRFIPVFEPRTAIKPAAVRFVKKHKLF